MTFFRKHGTTLLWGVATVTVVVGALAMFRPEWRSELVKLPGLAWVLAFVLFLLLSVAVRAVWSRDDEIGRLEATNGLLDEATIAAKAEASRAQLAETDAELNAEAARLRAEAAEANAAAASAALAAALAVPTDRDRALALEVMAVWDPNGRLFSFLVHGFNAKKWVGDQVEPLYDFVHRYENALFDDEVANAAFLVLHEAAAKLEHWLSTEGAPTSEDNQGRAPELPFVYSVRDFHVFATAQEYDAMREVGLQLSIAALDASREFELVARKRGL